LSLTAGGGTGGGWKPSETQEPILQSKRMQTDKKNEGDHDDARVKQSNCPLAGWPSLGVQPSQPVALVYVEGARVKLTGMRSKNGKVGTLLKMCGNGRWKVKMDNDDGIATLKQEYLMLIDPSEALAPSKQEEVAPIPQTMEPTVKQAEYSIVGTWDGWAEPRDMKWDKINKCYKVNIKLTYSFESFQILVGGNWETCLHPSTSTNGCPQSDYALVGPDRKANCRGLHWTIGKHPNDEGTRGNLYELKLFLHSDGKPSNVSWDKLNTKSGK